MSDVGAFVKRLSAIASLTRMSLTPDLIALYVERLSGLGYGSLCVALDSILDDPKRFPTIQDIKALLGASEASDEDKAREVAERIWSTIASGKGSMRNTEPADDAVGEIGAQVVRMAGGWNRLAETALRDQAAYLKAQWRELAEVVMRKHRSGVAFDELPKFERPRQGLVQVGQLLKISGLIGESRLPQEDLR